MLCILQIINKLSVTTCFSLCSTVFSCSTGFGAKTKNGESLGVCTNILTLHII